ncbi:MAG: hypothetical protein CMJ32_03465 [Phycisphaerae bacterium]|nr:hypothetical protein [Phycisphaerae bacterium]
MDHKPKITIKEATPDDLPVLAQLLRDRDEVPYETTDVEDYLFHCDPEHFLAWIAHVDDQPAGMTALYMRDVTFDHGEKIRRRSGFWSHLYIDPKYRKLMVYTQLVFAMNRAMRSSGIDMIYTATRQTVVAESHQKIGYRLMGTIPVDFRPLRPFRMLARHKFPAKFIEAAASVPDLGWRAWLSIGRSRAPGGVTIERIDTGDSRIEQIVAMMQDRARGTVAMDWSVEYFQKRFRTAIDHAPYRIHVASRDGQVIAASIHRVGDRHGIRFGIVIDLLVGPEDGQVGAALLSTMQDSMVRDGADAILSMGGMQEPVPGIVRSARFMRSPEQYHLLVYPGPLVPEESWEGDLDHWTFCFSDHDAF